MCLGLFYFSWYIWTVNNSDVICTETWLCVAIYMYLEISVQFIILDPDFYHMPFYTIYLKII